MYAFLEEAFEVIVRHSILALEAVGVIILLVSAVRALIELFRGGNGCKLEMAEGIGRALSFLLGGEVLKTIIAPDWHEIGMTCAILLMRAAISVLLYWEGKHEGQEHEGTKR